MFHSFDYPAMSKFSVLDRQKHFITKEAVAELFRDLDHSKIEEIVLSGNTFAPGAMKGVVENIRKMPNLKVLRLNDIFTMQKLDSVCESLVVLFGGLDKVLENIQTLDLSDNAISLEGSVILADALTRMTGLEELFISNAGLGLRGGSNVFLALSRCFEKLLASGAKPRLRSLNLGRNRLESQSMEPLGNALSMISDTISCVRIFQNGITSSGFLRLFPCLASCSKLAHLDLQDNTLNDRSIEELCLILPSWPSLQHLNVSDCLIGSSGAIQLARAIERLANNQIQDLLIEYNEIDEIAAGKIAGCVLNLPGLQRLCINGNNFSPSGLAYSALLANLERIGCSQALESTSDLESCENLSESDIPSYMTDAKHPEVNGDNSPEKSDSSFELDLRKMSIL